MCLDDTTVAVEFAWKRVLNLVVEISLLLAPLHDLHKSECRNSFKRRQEKLRGAPQPGMEAGLGSYLTYDVKS